MADDVTHYRARAEAERRAADETSLQNVRERCERAASAWMVMADRAERVGIERRMRENATALKNMVPVGE